MTRSKSLLPGLGVALVTPFNEHGAVDYPALQKIVEGQIEGGTDFLVVLGTTAESPTLLPCLLYTSPSPRDRQKSRMPSSA